MMVIHCTCLWIIDQETTDNSSHQNLGLNLLLYSLSTDAQIYMRWERACIITGYMFSYCLHLFTDVLWVYWCTELALHFKTKPIIFRLAVSTSCWKTSSKDLPCHASIASAISAKGFTSTHPKQSSAITKDMMGAGRWDYKYLPVHPILNSVLPHGQPHNFI